MNLSTRQLRAFLLLAQLRNFTRAAEAIHLSQPAFSAMIGALEETVGARLFSRDTRNVGLTTEGRVFEASARRVLQEFESALNDVRDHVERRRGRVSVAVLPSLAAGWLPPLLAEFHRTYPGIQFEVADVLSERGIARVRSGRADFCIATVSVDDSELQSSAYCTDRFHLVCRHDHRLASTPRIRVKDLAEERLIYQVRNSIVSRYLEAALRPYQANAVMEVEQLPTVVGMVRAGLGITAIPEFNLYDFHYPDLVHRELRFRGLIRRVFIVRPRGRPFSFAAQALYDLLIAKPPALSANRDVDDECVSDRLSVSQRA
jgi:DNA-binding transcriptional LysR family regulator